jgi:hypothetical protein
LPAREWKPPAQPEAEAADLQCRIEDLRDFEAGYRSRQIAYHEECLRKLRGEDVNPAPAGKREINCTGARIWEGDLPPVTGKRQFAGRKFGFGPIRASGEGGESGG